MKQKSTSGQSYDPGKNLLSWDELLKKGHLWKEVMDRLALKPGIPYRVKKSCTDQTFQKGDVIILESGNDLFCPTTGKRISPGQCTRENTDFE